MIEHLLTQKKTSQISELIYRSSSTHSSHPLTLIAYPALSNITCPHLTVPNTAFIQCIQVPFLYYDPPTPHSIKPSSHPRKQRAHKRPKN